MTGFYSIKGFPGVIGGINGTHVRVISPGGPDEVSYVNRKGKQDRYNVSHIATRSVIEKKHLEYGKGHSMCCMGRYGTNEMDFITKLAVIIKCCKIVMRMPN